MSQQSVNVNDPEEGDDAALHDFWALSEFDIRSLAALSESEKLELRRLGGRRR
jgi:hypothetical protein